MSNSVRKLPDGELEVMQAVWACPVPCTRKEISSVLFASHEMAETTLLTMLSRLSEKSFLEIRKKGRSSIYTPLVSQEEYLASQGKRFFRKLCQGNISVLANALCSGGLTREEVQELRSLLERDEL